MAVDPVPGLVCFDLDGTLVDPLLGVRNCLRKTCEAFGLEQPDEATIRHWIGFGMRESLGTLPGLEDPERLEAALDFYWERYREDGVFEHELYPGVFHLLHRLKRQGHRIYIVSAKPSLFVRRIAYQFDLNLIFDDIFGSNLKGLWQPKTEVLAGLVERGTIQPGGVFIGDRGVDMSAARDGDPHVPPEKGRELLPCAEALTPTLTASPPCGFRFAQSKTPPSLGVFPMPPICWRRAYRCDNCDSIWDMRRWRPR